MKQDISEAIITEKTNLELLSEAVMNRLLDGEIWVALAVILIKIIVITGGSALAVAVLRKIVRRLFNLKIRGPVGYSERRHTTLLKLLENVVSYVVYFAAILAVLSTLSINVTGLLAGAGILGLAIGFGAQNLVKDVITGFFIIFEDQFSVGDFVRIGTAEGTVEEIGLRTSKIKSYTGEITIIPNGSILEVVNFSLHNSMAIIDMSVSYETDMEKMETLLKGFLPSLLEKYEDIVKEPEFVGVQAIQSTEVVVRVVAETLPMKHFGIVRELRRELKQFLDENQIEIPYPKMVMVDQQTPAKKE